MKRNNKKCICCGKIYTYCNSCEAYAHLAPWHAIYHDQNCRTIFMAVTDYLAQEISKERAKEILDGCDLSNKAAFHPTTIAAIDEIYYVEPVIEPDAETTVEEVAEAIVSEAEVIQPIKMRTRKKVSQKNE